MSTLKVVFRADASIDIGTGHIMRCLTLAEELRVRGVDVGFACISFPGNLIALIREAGYICHELFSLKAPVLLVGDWLVVDHYQLDAEWEEAMRQQFRKIMVIDDLANRRHDCDLLLDQNYYTGMFARYQSLVPENCRMLLGPQYALLRPEFFVARKNLLARSGIVNRMLVFFGGSDPTNETMKALQAIEILQLPNVTIDVVVGSSNPNRQAVWETCQHMPACIFHCQVNNMAELIAQSDLAIGAGGSASWERCYLGLPTIGIIVADNQEQLVADLVEFGAMISLGQSKAVTVAFLADAICRVFHDRQLREKISRRCLELMSGHGSGTVIAAIMEDSDV